MYNRNSLVAAILVLMLTAIPTASQVKSLATTLAKSMSPVSPGAGTRFTDYEMYGPRVDYINATYRQTPAGTFDALDVHDIDIVDWPLYKLYVDLWTGRSDIVMKDTGGEYGFFIFDLNQNQTKPVVAGVNVDYYVPTGDPTLISYPLNPGDPPTTTTRGSAFRHALAHLVKRDYIVTTILGGFGSPLYSTVPLPYGSLVNPYVDQHPYDPTEAARILTAAGFIDTDGNGWRNKPGGTLPGGIPIGTGDIKFDFLFTGGSLGIWAVEQIIPAMETAGIDVIPTGPVSLGVAYGTVLSARYMDAYTGYQYSLTAADYMPQLFGRVGWKPPSAAPKNYMLYTGWRDTNNDGWTEPDPLLETYSTPWTPSSTFANMIDGYWYVILTSSSLDEVNAAFYNAQAVMQGAANVYTIPLWMSNAPKAYSAFDEHGSIANPIHQWKGIVNQRAFGVNSIWTCLNAYVDEHPDSGTIRYGLSTDDAISMNPIYAGSYFDWEIMNKIYDTLFKVDPDDPAALDEPGLKPWVAERWERTQEYDPQQGGAVVTTIKFYMRNDVYFHDGVQVKAQDVEFTLETVRATLAARGFPSPWWDSYVENIHRVDVLGDFTVKVWMKDAARSVFSLRKVGLNVPILPKHVWNPIVSTGVPTGFNPDPQLIGSGPFKVYPKDCNPWSRTSVYVPTVSFLLTAFKPKAGFGVPPEKHTDEGPNPGIMDLGESIYRDMDQNNIVSAGDVLLAGLGMPIGTALVQFRDDPLDPSADPTGVAVNARELHTEEVLADNLYNAGESVYRDMDGSKTFTAGDVLVAGPGGVPVGTPLIPFVDEQYIGYFRYSPIQVRDTVQTVNHPSSGPGIQEYILLENFKLSSATVDILVILVGTGPIRYLTGLVVPAASSGGSVSGKYFIDKTTVGTQPNHPGPPVSGTLIVRATPAVGIAVSYTRSFTSITSKPGDINGDLTVGLFDAILLSTSWGGNPGPSTSPVVTGPWKEPSGDFNDDNTIDIYDGIRLGTNWGDP